MTGAVPNTRGLEGLALDSQGFVRTGTDLSRADRVSGPDPRTGEDIRADHASTDNQEKGKRQ
jgi:hypothetical protein